MFPINESAVWARRNDAIYLRATTEPTNRDRRLAEEASGDDVPALLDALVQVYGELLSERHAIDERMDATDNELVAVVWARMQSEHAAATRGFGKVRHHA